MSEKNNIWERNFYIVSLVLLTSIPFGYFLSSMVFAIWFVFCVAWGIKNKHFKIDKKLLPFLIFSVFSFISIIWSQDQIQTVHGIGRQIPLLLFPVAGMFLPSISYQGFKQTFKLFSLFICGLGVIFIFLAIFKYQKYQYESFLFYHELVSPLKLNSIYISYIVSVCFLFMLQLTNKKNLWQLSVLVVLGVFLLMLVSKMILFVTFLISIIIILSKLKGRLQKIFILVAIVFVSIFIINYVRPIQNRFLREFNTSLSEILNTESFKKGRVYTGLEARLLQVRVFKEIVDTPTEYFFGVGLDASKDEIQEIHKRLNTPIAFQTYNFHNQFIQVFAELGIIGLFLLALLLYIGFKRSKQLNLLLPFMIISTALFFSESVIWRQRGIMFFGIMYIILLTINQAHESEKSV